MIIVNLLIKDLQEYLLLKTSRLLSKDKVVETKEKKKSNPQTNKEILLVSSTQKYQSKKQLLPIVMLKISMRVKSVTNAMETRTLVKTSYQLL